jgi:predicted DNA-binding protein (MmcQ/YjbR family)
MPEAHEVEAWGEPTFRVRNKIFAGYAAAHSDHGVGRPAVTFKAAPGEQAVLLAQSPQRFFVPPYVGSKGWVGAWLDQEVDWEELGGLLLHSYRLVAPKRWLAKMDEI